MGSGLAVGDAFLFLGDAGKGFRGRIADEAVLVVHGASEDFLRGRVGNLAERPGHRGADARFLFFAEADRFVDWPGEMVTPWLSSGTVS